MVMVLLEVKIIELKVFGDVCGFFYESFNGKEFVEQVVFGVEFVQDNYLCLLKGVLCGLYYQIQYVQGKFVCVVEGEVFDVVVDICKNLLNFGKWVGVVLLNDNYWQLWVLFGFVYGFVVVLEVVQFFYKMIDYWFLEYECSIVWNDLEIGIEWLIDFELLLVVKDVVGKCLSEVEVYV